MARVRLSKFFTFSSFIWLLAAAGVFFLVGLPPLQDAWACYRWERVPCKLNGLNGNRGFLFQYEGTRYVSLRRDFWDRESVDSIRTGPAINADVFDRTCYVAPHTPTSAVLTLDAHKRFDHAGASLFLSAFVISGAIALTLVSSMRRKNAAKH